MSSICRGPLSCHSNTAKTTATNEAEEYYSITIDFPLACALAGRRKEMGMGRSDTRNIALCCLLMLVMSPTARDASVCNGTLTEVSLSARDDFAASVIYDQH